MSRVIAEPPKEGRPLAQGHVCDPCHQAVRGVLITRSRPQCGGDKGRADLTLQKAPDGMDGMRSNAAS